MGNDEISTSPVMFYLCQYCLFSAFVAPFAGFFASGMKRAYKVKDFGKTFPGHGGIIDRFDCISYTILFNYFMVSQVILVD